ncbi:MAG: alpha/beta hydrolase [Propionibacteriaceae bacterium]|jgi:pimeloyl-ACP methyl ester carboxylesterase|nr:alpha/beta hydrolase [Propionibacteriaceae bacterium]
MVVDGLSVHYEVRGTGPWVFLLHGWGANLGLFADVAAVIATKYTVVSLDFPGCGGTDEPPVAWGMDDYTRFTAHFIATFGAAEIILLGHSHGGRVAIRLATDPGLGFRVTKLILVDSAGLVPRRSWRYHARVRAYKAGKMVLGWKPVAAVFPDALEDLRRRTGSADYTAASPVMRATLVKVVNTDLAPVLPGITAETLLVWGDRDTATPLADGQTMEKAIPGSGLVILPGAGHFSFLDGAYTFRRVIESFLQIG